MAEVEVRDEVVEAAPRAAVAGQAPPRRAVVVDAVDARSGAPIAIPRGGAGIEDESIGSRGDAGKARVFKESTLKLLERLEHPDDGDGGEDDPDAAVVDGVAPVADVAPQTDQTTQAAAPIAPLKDEGLDKARSDELRETMKRLIEHNRQLVAAAEAAGKAPRGDVGEREKTLNDVESTYLDDSVGAIRKLIGVVLGVAPDSKDVDAELSGLYTDLTSRELNVPLEAAHKATREAARARQMFARDKRERKAESEQQNKRPSEDHGRKDEDAATYIAPLLTNKGADGKSIADNHPMLMNLSEDLDGLTPQMLLWKVVEKETKAGTLDPKLSDAQLLEAAAKLVEEHYNAVSDKIARAKPVRQETAQPGNPAQPSQASKDPRQSTAARPITNASASVAPSTPPKQPAPKPAEEMPKFKNSKEKKEWLLKKYFPD